MNWLYLGIGILLGVVGLFGLLALLVHANETTEGD